MRFVRWLKWKRRRHYLRKTVAIPTPLTNLNDPGALEAPIDGFILVYGKETVRRHERIRRAYTRGVRKGWRWRWEPA